MLEDRIASFSSENTGAINGIFVGSALPRAVGIGKVHRRIQAACDDVMVGEFDAIVKRNRFHGLREVAEHR